MTSSSINVTAAPDEVALNASTECFLPSTVETIPSETLRYCILLWYIATALLALTGNVIVMIVQMYGLRSKGGIRKYLINLAISDIVSGVICVPFTYLNTVLGHWSFPLWLCPAGQFLQLLSVFVTSTTLSVIAIERYTVTLYPHCQLARLLKASKTVTLVVVWLLGVAYASPLLAHTGVVQFEMHQTLYYECKFDIGLSDSKRHIFIVANLCLTFILPLLLMIATYSAIMMKVYHRNSIPLKIQTHHCLVCKRQITHLCAVKSREKCSQSVCCSQPCQQRIQRRGAKRYKLTRHCSLDNRYRVTQYG